MEDDKAFFMLYCSVVSFQFHPGVEKRLTSEEALAAALDYFRGYKYWAKEVREWAPG